MKLFLTKDVANLGSLGEVVSVKSGYARNFLIPRGLGVELGRANLQWIEAQKKRVETQEVERLAGLQSQAEAINGASCTLIARATEEGHLFGSVTAANICEQMTADGIEIDPDTIVLEKPIKELGIYNLAVNIHPEVETGIKVWVVKADEDGDSES
ncbi:MAG: 50S ribosomal protein L9 [Planctomycetia bacterium]|nr:50S ribosomal protein L9 [Planctomycetia bacterium]MBL6914877.1 50S ribosomal protein L9 [Planctomycetota bacterium]